MLCAFSNTQELQQCLSVIQSTHSEQTIPIGEIQIFQANQNSRVPESQMEVVDEEDCETGQTTMYGVWVKSSNKVNVIQEWRGMDDLRKLFPKIDVSRINSVWEHQQSWSACFDVLNSMLRSHGSVLVEPCSIVIDDVHFPALTVSRPLFSAPHSDLHTRDRQDSFHSHDGSVGSEWSVLSLNDSVGRISLGSDWEVLNGDPEHNFMSAEPSPVQKSSTVILSYRDAVLKKAAIEDVATTESIEHRRMARLIERERVWKPVFVLTKVSSQRVDRIYVGVTGEQDYQPDDDDDYYWDQCTDSKFSSSVLGVKRVAGISRLRPAQMEQKMKRIALKSK